MQGLQLGGEASRSPTAVRAGDQAGLFIGQGSDHTPQVVSRHPHVAVADYQHLVTRLDGQVMEQAGFAVRPDRFAGDESDAPLRKILLQLFQDR